MANPTLSFNKNVFRYVKGETESFYTVEELPEELQERAFELVQEVEAERRRKEVWIESYQEGFPFKSSFQGSSAYYDSNLGKFVVYVRDFLNGTAWLLPELLVISYTEKGNDEGTVAYSKQNSIAACQAETFLLGIPDIVTPEWVESRFFDMGAM